MSQSYVALPAPVANVTYSARLQRPAGHRWGIPAADLQRYRTNAVALMAATPHLRSDGVVWYHVAHGIAADLAATATAAGRPLSIAQTAGVISAMSPQMSWSRNERAARYLVGAWLADVRPDSPDFNPNGETSTAAGWAATVHKAFRIMDGDGDPAAVGAHFNRSSAPKTLDFWHCICNPAAPGPVCVDGHMVNAVHHGTGDRVGITSAPSLTTVTYDTIAAAIAAAAAEFGILPQQAQAWVWLAYRDADGGAA